MILPVSIEARLSCGVFFCKVFENKASSAYVEISGVVFPAQIFEKNFKQQQFQLSILNILNNPCVYRLEKERERKREKKKDKKSFSQFSLSFYPSLSSTKETPPVSL